MIPIKVIMFDLDGTLLDDTRSTLQYRKQFYEHHSDKIPYTFQEYFNLWESRITSDLDAVSKKKISLHDVRRNRIRMLFNNPGLTDGEAELFVNEYISLYRSAWTVFDDAKPMLEVLSRHYPLAVVTNGDNDLQREKIAGCGLSAFFVKVITSEDAGVSKPDPQIFAFAAECMGVLPQECLFIGDSYAKDAVGALHAGMNPVWICRTGGIAECEVSSGMRYIHSLTEVQGLLSVSGGLHRTCRRSAE